MADSDYLVSPRVLAILYESGTQF